MIEDIDTQDIRLTTEEEVENLRGPMVTQGKGAEYSLCLCLFSVLTYHVFTSAMLHFFVSVLCVQMLVIEMKLQLLKKNPGWWVAVVVIPTHICRRTNSKTTGGCLWLTGCHFLPGLAPTAAWRWQFPANMCCRPFARGAAGRCQPLLRGLNGKLTTIGKLPSTCARGVLFLVWRSSPLASPESKNKLYIAHITTSDDGAPECCGPLATALAGREELLSQAQRIFSAFFFFFRFVEFCMTKSTRFLCRKNLIRLFFAPISANPRSSILRRRRPADRESVLRYGFFLNDFTRGVVPLSSGDFLIGSAMMVCHVLNIYHTQSIDVIYNLFIGFNNYFSTFFGHQTAGCRQCFVAHGDLHFINIIEDLMFLVSLSEVSVAILVVDLAIIIISRLLLHYSVCVHVKEMNLAVVMSCLRQHWESTHINRLNAAKLLTVFCITTYF
ncbi:hypothetical protein VP01_2180g2 [Puccinia sorghi]|uniref:Uncharacterized protein n=1 Tax=Puccinia sorghi TaxID=27349 RepID=A0A0L6V9Z2_9BASI|nr:hypothetical protein VP01_2180g2 [Puccinia sorghi]